MPAQWFENDVLVGGAPFHYTRTGGVKPVLVLAHGFSDNGLCWLPVARALEADFDVIMPDARGHGRSARVQPGEAIDRAADLAGLMEALGLRQAVVGGHSMGASTAAQLAARFPDLVRALILEDPAWRAPAPLVEKPTEPPANSFGSWLVAMQEKSVDELVAQVRAESPTWPEVELLPWAESKKQFDLGIFKSAFSIANDWQEVVANISCPSLLITAELQKGAIVPEAVAQQVLAMNAHFRWVQVANAGHSIRRENFTDFMSAVRSFLKEIPSL